MYFHKDFRGENCKIRANQGYPLDCTHFRGVKGGFFSHFRGILGVLPKKGPFWGVLPPFDVFIRPVLNPAEAHSKRHLEMPKGAILKKFFFR